MFREDINVHTIEPNVFTVLIVIIIEFRVCLSGNLKHLFLVIVTRSGRKEGEGKCFSAGRLGIGMQVQGHTLFLFWTETFTPVSQETKIFIVILVIEQKNKIYRRSNNTKNVQVTTVVNYLYMI